MELRLVPNHVYNILVGGRPPFENPCKEVALYWQHSVLIHTGGQMEFLAFPAIKAPGVS